jgi:hypothetical protein
MAVSAIPCQANPKLMGPQLIIKRVFGQRPLDGES